MKKIIVWYSKRGDVYIDYSDPDEAYHKLFNFIKDEGHYDHLDSETHLNAYKDAMNGSPRKLLHLRRYYEYEDFSIEEVY